MNEFMVKSNICNEANAVSDREADIVTHSSYIKKLGVSHQGARVVVIAFLFLSSITISSRGLAQTAIVENSTNILTQMSKAFSKGRGIQKVQLSGNASWHAGSLEDSGSVELTASKDGSSEMRLQLSTSGIRTESQSHDTEGGRRCYWSGNDGKAHEIRSGGCQRSALWFLPTLSLQSAQTNRQIAVVDKGIGPVGSGDTVYRHLQSQLLLNMNGMPNTIADEMAKQSKTDIGLDPNSLLPSVVSYSVHADGGASVPITIEVHYSDYRLMDGVQIPFHIQRYVNGSLQLDIEISTVQIN